MMTKLCLLKTALATEDSLVITHYHNESAVLLKNSMPGFALSQPELKIRCKCMKIMESTTVQLPMPLPTYNAEMNLFSRNRI